MSIKEALIGVFSDDPINWLKWGIVFVILIGGYIIAIPLYGKVSSRLSWERKRDIARSRDHVYVDGIVGPWFLEPWLGAARKGYEVHYMVLRASREITLRRAVERSKLDLKTNTELVEIMWEQFCDLGKYEANVIDTLDCF